MAKILIQASRFLLIYLTFRNILVMSMMNTSLLGLVCRMIVLFIFFVSCAFFTDRALASLIEAIEVGVALLFGLPVWCLFICFVKDKLMKYEGNAKWKSASLRAPLFPRSSPLQFPFFLSTIFLASFLGVVTRCIFSDSVRYGFFALDSVPLFCAGLGLYLGVVICSKIYKKNFPVPELEMERQKGSGRVEKKVAE